jgi:hypothetical protein
MYDRPKFLPAYHDLKAHVSGRKERRRKGALLMYDRPKLLPAYHNLKAHVSRRKEGKKEGKKKKGSSC